ncbi:cytochrome c oxidase assembly factor 6 homolog [Acropora muricata]|uniref:cytochrome c oxidase assembly factor 6 homolog n=1 Tax=Acropora millepora TaxID=45264 RepID=UPI001CF3C67E|nr:cytochrome c oxidase assembly factor 6 homolog [Acropora millepora]
MPAPSGEERRRCHAARDSYFTCLSSNNNNESACSKEKEVYENVCPSVWVNYFAKKRVYDEYKRKLNNEGFKPTDEKPSNGRQ